jgi:hypothetical protein
MPMGIPGTVKYSSSPTVPLGQHVSSHRDIGNMTYSGEFGSMSVPNMWIASSALSKLEPTVCLDADDSSNGVGRGKHHLYLGLHNREREELRPAAKNAVTTWRSSVKTMRDKTANCRYGGGSRGQGRRNCHSGDRSTLDTRNRWRPSTSGNAKRRTFNAHQ